MRRKTRKYFHARKYRLNFSLSKGTNNASGQQKREIKNKEIKNELYPSSEEYYQLMTKIKEEQKNNNYNIIDEDSEENEKEENTERKNKRIGNYK